MAKQKSKKRTWRKRLFFSALLVLAFLFAWRVPQHRASIAAGVFLLCLIWLAMMVRKSRVESTLAHIDAMDGLEFEQFLLKLFRKKGFKTRHVGGGSGDFGADIIIEKDGIKIAVQAKNYTDGKVGNEAVQQSVAGASYYDCQEAMVITNSTFTNAAKKQAEGSNMNVILWDRKALKEAIQKQ